VRVLDRTLWDPTTRGGAIAWLGGAMAPPKFFLKKNYIIYKY